MPEKTANSPQVAFHCKKGLASPRKHAFPCSQEPAMRSIKSWLIIVLAAYLNTAAPIDCIAADDGQQAADSRITKFNALYEKRKASLELRTQLSKQVVQFDKTLTDSKRLVATMTLRVSRLEGELARLEQATGTLTNQRAFAPIVRQLGIDRQVEANSQRLRALQEQRGTLVPQLASLSARNVELEDQLDKASKAIRQSDRDANRMRREWLELIDPFGQSSASEQQQLVLMFSDWIAQDVKDGGALLERGFAYWRLKDYDKAMSDFDRTVAIGGPMATLAMAARGSLSHALGKRRDGLAELGRALTIDAANGTIFLLRAIARLSEKNYLAASSDLNSAVQLNDRDARARQQMATFLACCPHKSMRNGKKALADAQRACELTEWKDWTCLDALAAANAEVGRFEDAAKWETKAAELATDENRELCHERLAIYQTGKPLRIEWAVAIPLD